MSNDLLVRLGIEDLDLILKERRLRWYGHVERSSGAIKTAFDIQFDGKRVRSAMRAASQLSGRGPTDVDVDPVPAR